MGVFFKIGEMVFIYVVKLLYWFLLYCIKFVVFGRGIEGFGLFFWFSYVSFIFVEI